MRGNIQFLECSRMRWSEVNMRLGCHHHQNGTEFDRIEPIPVWSWIFMISPKDPKVLSVWKIVTALGNKLKTKNVLWEIWRRFLMQNSSWIRQNTYCKIPSSRLSWLVAHARIFRMFMKGNFDAYVPWNNGPKLNSRPVY